MILANFCFAQRPPEVPLPGLSETTSPLLPDYVKYIFNFAIGIAGLVAFGCLIYGGVRHLTSAGDPSATGDAKDQIFAGLIGLVVILGSYLLLTTINPQLIVINPTLVPSGLATTTMPGVYLCKDAAGTDCQVFTQSVASIGNLKGQVQSIKFTNTADNQYMAVLHEDENYEGRCAICAGNDCSPGLNNISHVNGVSSIHVFLYSDFPSPGSGVTLYEGKEYNKNCPKCQSWGPYKNQIIELNEMGRSVKIDEPGKHLAVLFEGTGYQGECEVFFQSDPDLASNSIGICGQWSNLGCFGSVAAYQIK